MSVSEEDRKAYEEGVAESNKSFIEQLVDFGATFRDMGRSESEHAAFDKGLSGEQLDGDKK